MIPFQLYCIQSDIGTNVGRYIWKKHPTFWEGSNIPDPALINSPAEELRKQPIVDVLTS